MNTYSEISTGDRARELLEDFDVLATRRCMALVPRQGEEDSLKQNVQAALAASSVHLKSLDYARKRYVEQGRSGTSTDAHVPYVEAYKLAKNHVRQNIRRLRTNGRPDPTVGVFGASLALERLPASFFCAHFMYRMGHKYEGHAVSRLILEQIAWAFAAHVSDDMAYIERIEATRAIGGLKTFLPEAGRLYGFLSTKTHIDFSSHDEFLKVEDGKNFVLHAHPNFEEFAHVMLTLADMFALVWEVSQVEYLDELESIHRGTDGLSLVPRSSRPFLTTIEEQMQRLRQPAGDA